MKIITERLKILCVTKVMYHSLVKKKKYNEIKVSHNWPSLEVKKIIEGDLKHYKNLSELMKWSVWVVVLRDTDELIGSVGFKEVPNYNGEVEVCYEINERYQKKGYCMEAVEALIDMAINDIRVDHIIAECLLDNTASKRVLEKLDFAIIGRDEEQIYWKKK